MIDDIVVEVDVVKGSFYNYFEDKEGLVSVIFELVYGDCEFYIFVVNCVVDDLVEWVICVLCVMIVYVVEYFDWL